MCELLAISANKPVGVSFSWAGFESAGTRNPDGWGYAYLQDASFERYRCARPLAVEDEAAPQAADVVSPVFLGHVRRAVQGDVRRVNAQPFVNVDGRLTGIFTVSRCRITCRFRGEVEDRRVGDTGAEILFRLLSLRTEQAGDLAPALADVVEEVIDPEQLGSEASASFVLSRGRQLYAFRHNKPLWWVTRAPPHANEVRLRDPTLPSNKASLQLEKGPEETATVLATVRLTDEDGWELLPAGNLPVFRDGHKIREFPVR